MFRVTGRGLDEDLAKADLDSMKHPFEACKRVLKEKVKARRSLEVTEPKPA